MKAHEIANKEELIKALRWCGSDDDDNEYCVDANYGCPYFKWDKPKDDCKQEMMRDAADAIEAVQPEQKWIPCGERLPEEYGNYLITTYDGNVDIGTIDPKGKSVWSACDADGFYWMRNVIAWMPLPEPWKGAEQ